MLSEQDAFAPLLGPQPAAEHEAKRPFPRDNTAVVGHKDRAIRLRLIGKGFRDFVIAIEDRFVGAQFGLFSCNGGYRPSKISGIQSRPFP